MNPSLVATPPPATEPALLPDVRADPPIFAPQSAIEEAIAVVARRSGCTAEEAFALLRTTAHDRRTKLRTVAEQLIASMHTDPTSALPEAPLHDLRRESYWD